jgi:hypothetical protein
MVMFRIKNSVNYNGKIYCWNTETNSIVEIEGRDVSLKDAPEDVVELLLKNAYSGDGNK